MHIFETLIIGAGAAGIGTALKLKELSVDYLVLEADTIGASFKKWNSETRFISPSFPGNAFGQVDLNSIHYETSPGFMFQKEHMSGAEYEKYLNALVLAFDLQVMENTRVASVEKKDEYFVVQTEDGQEYYAHYIVSAVGEFLFPSDGDIQGAENAIHSSLLRNYEDYSREAGPIAIIGGYESSVDAAYGLYKKGIHSEIFCPHTMEQVPTSDPSQILSLNSFERLKYLQENGAISTHKETVRSIKKSDESYTIVGESGENYNFTQKPILATGFRSGLSYLGDLVSYREDGNAKLKEYDELEKQAGIFIVGPQVRQDELIFCFVYKFRLRFGVVALEIARRLEKDVDYKGIRKSWEKQGFFLDDLSCCGDECSC